MNTETTDERLVVGISSSALFDTRLAHGIYTNKGLELFVKHQIENENNPFSPGTAFPLVKALLKLNNAPQITPRIELVIMSKNEPSAALRIFNSVKALHLPITVAAFTGGEPVSDYLQAYDVSIFLSNDRADVENALIHGFPAAQLYEPPESTELSTSQIRIAFDGDSVIFSNEADLVYDKGGRQAFHEHERNNANTPLPDGPFAKFLRLLAKLQSSCAQFPQLDIPSIETALITARDGPAHERVIRTLRSWGIRFNQMFFLGARDKSRVLKALKPHIFFDDKEKNVAPASRVVPSGLVPANTSTSAPHETFQKSYRNEKSSTNSHEAAQLVSQRHFEVECRRILRQYLPLGSKNSKLPAELQSFVGTSKLQSPKKRTLLLTKLKKYDLQTDVHYQGLFNREGKVDPLKKLNKLLKELEDCNE